MTRKDKTIAACRELIEKYRHPEGKMFFNRKHCLLCDIYYKSDAKRSEEFPCAGCFMGDNGPDACSFMITYSLAANYLYHIIPLEEVHFTGYEIRARFHELAIPILEKIDEKYFTPDGWEYEVFDEIRELDRKLAEGEIK